MGDGGSVVVGMFVCVLRGDGVSVLCVCRGVTVSMYGR